MNTSQNSHPPGPPVNTQTMLNAVTGYPLGHTWSPQLHELIYKSLGVNAMMLAFPQTDLGTIITSMRALPIRLLAVTLPHKQEIIKHLDVLDETAEKIGAVNTVINRGGKLHGYNTDVVGIEKALNGTEIKNKNVLVLGAGGAARPLCWFLKNHGANIYCVNRTREKSETLMKEFGGTAVDLKWLETGKIDVIINATPVGMEPNIHESPLSKKFLRSGQTVFDFIYNPLETQLLKDAKNAGAKTVSGLTMLIGQALAQVELWLGKELKYENIEKEFRNHILYTL